MLTVLSSILGFATSGLPNLLKFFEQKGDQKHELEMAKLEMERALAMAEKGFASEERISEMETYATERIALYNHDNKLQTKTSPWVNNLRASVRPIVTYAFVSLLLFVDIAGLIWAIHTGVEFGTALSTVFSPVEEGIIGSIIGFWFGSRHWQK